MSPEPKDEPTSIVTVILILVAVSILLIGFVIPVVYLFWRMFIDGSGSGLSVGG